MPGLNRGGVALTTAEKQGVLDDLLNGGEIYPEVADALPGGNHSVWGRNGAGANRALRVQDILAGLGFDSVDFGHAQSAQTQLISEGYAIALGATSFAIRNAATAHTVMDCESASGLRIIAPDDGDILISGGGGTAQRKKTITIQGSETGLEGGYYVFGGELIFRSGAGSYGYAGNMTLQAGEGLGGFGRGGDLILKAGGGYNFNGYVLIGLEDTSSIRIGAETGFQSIRIAPGPNSSCGLHGKIVQQQTLSEDPTTAEISTVLYNFGMVKR